MSRSAHILGCGRFFNRHRSLLGFSKTSDGATLNMLSSSSTKISIPWHSLKFTWFFLNSNSHEQQSTRRWCTSSPTNGRRYDADRFLLSVPNAEQAKHRPPSSHSEDEVQGSELAVIRSKTAATRQPDFVDRRRRTGPVAKRWAAWAGTLSGYRH